MAAHSRIWTEWLTNRVTYRQATYKPATYGQVTYKWLVHTHGAIGELMNSLNRRNTHKKSLCEHKTSNRNLNDSPRESPGKMVKCRIKNARICLKNLRPDWRRWCGFDNDRIAHSNSERSERSKSARDSVAFEVIPLKVTKVYTVDSTVVKAIVFIDIKRCARPVCTLGNLKAILQQFCSNLTALFWLRSSEHLLALSRYSHSLPPSS